MICKFFTTNLNKYFCIFVLNLCILNNILVLAGALVKWLWDETHVLKVVSSNPSIVIWMEFFTLI